MPLKNISKYQSTIYGGINTTFVSGILKYHYFHNKYHMNIIFSNIQKFTPNIFYVFLPLCLHENNLCHTSGKDKARFYRRAPSYVK